MTTSPASFVNPDELARVAANLAEVRRRIVRAGGDLASVGIVAVTKTFDAATVRAGAAAGLTMMGENYVDELTAKRASCQDLAVSWHFLGALQSNKISRVLAVADVVSGVSRDKEIRKIAEVRAGTTIDIQVDLTGSPGRNGAARHDVATLVALARAEGLDVRGLMTVASPETSTATRQFATLHTMATDLGLRGRSMGMSDDLEVAVEQGSTEVRVGRALFGPRPTHTTLT